MKIESSVVDPSWDDSTASRVPGRDASTSLVPATSLEGQDVAKETHVYINRSSPFPQTHALVDRTFGENFQTFRDRSYVRPYPNKGKQRPVLVRACVETGSDGLDHQTHHETQNQFNAKLPCNLSYIYIYV